MYVFEIINHSDATVIFLRAAVTVVIPTRSWKHVNTRNNFIALTMVKPLKPRRLAVNTGRNAEQLGRACIAVIRGEISRVLIGKKSGIAISLAERDGNVPPFQNRWNLKGKGNRVREGVKEIKRKIEDNRGGDRGDRTVGKRGNTQKAGGCVYCSSSR